MKGLVLQNGTWEERRSVLAAVELLDSVRCVSDKSSDGRRRRIYFCKIESFDGSARIVSGHPLLVSRSSADHTVGQGQQQMKTRARPAHRMLFRWYLCASMSTIIIGQLESNDAPSTAGKGSSKASSAGLICSATCKRVGSRLVERSDRTRTCWLMSTIAISVLSLVYSSNVCSIVDLGVSARFLQLSSVNRMLSRTRIDDEKVLLALVGDVTCPGEEHSGDGVLFDISLRICKAYGAADAPHLLW